MPQITFEEASGELCALQTELEQLRKAHEVQISELRLSEAKNAYEGAQQDASLAAETLDTALKARTQLARRGLAREIEQANSRVNALSSELARLSGEIKSSEAECTSHVASLESQRQDSVKLFSSLKREIAALATEGAALLARHAAQIEAAEAGLSRETAKAQKEAPELSDTVEKLSAQCESKLEALQADIQTAEEARKRAQQTHAEKIADNALLVQRHDGESKDAHDSVERIASALSEALCDEKLIANLIDEERSCENPSLVEAESQRHDVEVKLEEADFEAEIKMDAVKSLKAESASETDIATAQEDSDLCSELLREAREDFEKKNAAVEALQVAAAAKMEALQARMVSAISCLNGLRDDLANKKRELDALTACQTSLRTDAEEALSLVGKQHDEAKHRVAQLTKRAETIQATHSVEVQAAKNHACGDQERAARDLSTMKETHTCELSDHRALETGLEQRRSEAKQKAVEQKNEADLCKKTQAVFSLGLQDKIRSLEEKRASAIKDVEDKEQALNTLVPSRVEEDNEVGEAKSAPQVIQRLQDQMTALEFKKQKAMHPEIEDFESCILYRDEINQVRETVPTTAARGKLTDV